MQPNQAEPTDSHGSLNGCSATDLRVPDCECVTGWLRTGIMQGRLETYGRWIWE